MRVHQAIKRRGIIWESGQKVKIFKGATGCLKKNLYATLEYILIEGFQGDVGGKYFILLFPVLFSLHFSFKNIVFYYNSYCIIFSTGDARLICR